MAEARSVGKMDSNSVKNPVWKYFSKLPSKNEARCEQCKTLLKTPTGTTTTLSNHLKKHPSLYAAYEEERAAREKQKKSAGQSTPQPSVSSHFRPTMKSTAPKARQVTQKIAAFIAGGLHSYSVVEENGFVEMLRCVIPEYSVPSRTTFSRSVIPDLYAAKKAEVMQALRSIFDAGVECYCLTTDSWTSRACQSYVSVTCHIMDKKFVQHIYTLTCGQMTEDCTAENIRRFLQNVIKDWELPEGLPTYIVTDNGRNFVAAVEHSQWHRVQCFAHTLQLCITDAKKHAPGFLQLCAKARSIVGYYKRSTRARARLQDMQRNMQMEPLEVIQDVPTRWNSEHAMMSRLLELRTAISAELSASDSVENLSSAEWKRMAWLVSVLQPIQQATTELSATKYPTLSQVIPLLECTEITLKEYISEANEVASFAISLLRSLKTRFVDVKMSPLLVLATLVDPRYKAVFHSAESTPSQKLWASSLLLSEVEKLHSTGTAETREHGSAASTTEEAYSVWTAFSKVKMALEETRQSAGISPCQKQVNEYLKTPLLGRSEDPLLWWSTLGIQLYSAVATVAQKYLSIPATQAASERVFSTDLLANMCCHLWGDGRT
ncbi:hypothetical protein HPB47_017298 [Ixodes persulcatus]|uniref:Uncharacterized protein n=1 Tax=Ixodes persulcatus TaxID=34615 RepID=A0AC60QNN4_IXOPE|nr:hypothetical protein HPB47_017298 [Ixodes persulcatus]